MKTSTTPAAPSTLTFVLDLGDGTRCTAKIDMAQAALSPVEELPGIVGFEFEGQLQNRHWPIYFPWVKSVFQHVADTAHKSVVLLFYPPAVAPFAVVFEPHQPCETVSLPRP